MNKPASAATFQRKEVVDRTAMVLKAYNEEPPSRDNIRARLEFGFDDR